MAGDVVTMNVTENVATAMSVAPMESPQKTELAEHSKTLIPEPREVEVETEAAIVVETQSVHESEDEIEIQADKNPEVVIAENVIEPTEKSTEIVAELKEEENVEEAPATVIGVKRSREDEVADAEEEKAQNETEEMQQSDDVESKAEEKEWFVVRFFKRLRRSFSLGSSSTTPAEATN
eukprot:Colp12_sorted_trinity150504_noHs@5099